MSNLPVTQVFANTLGQQRASLPRRSEGLSRIDIQYLTKFNQVSMDSTLANSRRTPPLPRSGSSTMAILGQRLQHRPSYHKQNSMTKNPSRISLHSQTSRRYGSGQLQHRNSSREQVDPSHQPEELRDQTVLRGTIATDGHMAMELLKVVREENDNLKEQNNFLLRKVRQLNSREKALKQTVSQYEALITQLSEQNEDLKKQVEDMNEDSKKKIAEFQEKLSSMINQRKSIASQHIPLLKPQVDYISIKPASERGNVVSPSQFYFRTMSNLDGQAFHQYLSNEQFNPGREPSDHENAKEDNESLQMQLNNQFEALIYSCRVEKVPEKRKEIRKKLVQLTYKMRALGKK